jgi:hypothetical protein
VPPYTTTLFLKYFFNLFNTSLKENLNILKSYINTIMLSCILEIILEYFIKKYFQIVLLMSKLFFKFF